MRVTVVGAGPAGASAAAALATLGLETTLTDPCAAAGGQGTGDGGWRVGEGLPGAAGVHLRSLGVWDTFRAGGHLPCGGFLSRWGGTEPAFRSTLLDPHGPSWQIDRRRFDAMLRDAAGAAGARGPLPWRLAALERRRPGGQGRGWRLTFVDGTRTRVLESDFLIDATGRRGRLARLLGARRRVDSSLVAVVGMLRDPDPANATTLIEAAGCGWWYASRVPGDRLVVALFTDGRAGARDGLTGAGGWLRALRGTDLIGDRAGGGAAEPEGPFRVTAAGSSRLDRCGARDWLAVGDAACAHDPLSSRGLYDALETGLTAARRVADAAGGDETAVPAYADGVASAYQAYLRDLAWFYDQEERFRAAPFWRRRRAADG